MVDLLELKLPEDKKKQGRPNVGVFEKWANPTMMDCLKTLYERIAERSRKYNISLYGRKNKVIEKIADKYLKAETYDAKEKNLESLLSHINHSKKHRTTKKKK